MTIILLSAITGIASVLAFFSYRSLLKLRTEVKTTQKEMIDLRNHINQSIIDLKKAAPSTICPTEK